jgi:hypothetical protein
MRITVFFVCLLVVTLSLPQTSWANCEVTLKVLAKPTIPVLCHGDCDVPSTHSVILKPQREITKSEECAAYSNTKEFRMNNVEQHDKAFQELEVGDVVTGTLNYHRPSPYGKHLNDNYHHGFRLLKSKDEDHSQKYTYFRHIGLY